ncbi:MAG: hypothetical protein KF696_15295 [Planctomycetes bacterium]|nr:hypothetical protein [Planctomycetota bacterium]MCW8136037.1 hypothetical protein [Planctomycetota bacterium]
MDFRDDLQAFVRGTLEPNRAQALLAAAQHDPELRKAIEQERTLEQWLDIYEVPELSPGFQGRFWKNFHERKLYGETPGRSGLLLKLVGPVAALLLVGVGIFMFLRDGDAPANTPVEVADDAADSDAEEIEFNEFEYLVADEPAPARAEKPSLEELRLLRQLADPAFADLDRVGAPEDLDLIRERELLEKLAAREAE